MGNSPVRPGPIAVRLFGTFEIQRSGDVLSAADLGGCKPRHILEILLLNLGSPVSKAHIVETVWGPGHGAGTVAALESYICGIRRMIQPGNTKGGPLRTVNGGYVLDPALVDLDLFRFRRMVESAARVRPEDAYELLTEALAMSAEPLLSGELGADWADVARAGLATERLAVQVKAAETAGLLERPLDAIHWATMAITSDPLHERAWTLLVTAYESCGLVAEGLAAYARCRSAFDRELGCAPGPALQAAYLRLLRQRAEDDADLAEVMAALVYLGDSLNAAAEASRGCPKAGLAREEAGRIVASFLRKAQVAV
ncbi:BTAD domain-containing putative transcriptional regulator [Pseudarthrobacter equi]|uniref:AfsR/SARP family transcriptional regulator n=1 Tax=Pseudarthrobacter equi TaxID=728066 RepID=UPI0021C13D9E|nr:BTAD domain-containing putative transcriptional regulator [Pseudarthrobacter equi]